MRIAYDCELRRPGCVLLQAALGGSIGVADLFPVETWLIAPTANLKVYEVTNDELDTLVDITKEKP